MGNGNGSIKFFIDDAATFRPREGLATTAVFRGTVVDRIIDAALGPNGRYGLNDKRVPREPVSRVNTTPVAPVSKAESWKFRATTYEKIDVPRILRETREAGKDTVLVTSKAGQWLFSVTGSRSAHAIEREVGPEACLSGYESSFTTNGNTIAGVRPSSPQTRETAWLVTTRHSAGDKFYKAIEAARAIRRAQKAERQIDVTVSTL